MTTPQPADHRLGPDAAAEPSSRGDAGFSPSPVVRLRNTFTITSHRGAGGNEQHLITAPKHGPDRTQARRAIMDVLRYADEHHYRVSFLLTLGDYTQHSVNIRHGYDAKVVLLHCKIEQDDPYAWLQRQISPSCVVNDVNAIIGVTITSWPQSPPASGKVAS